nr:8900_t:CDS:2 [Entrophospora candida]
MNNIIIGFINIVYKTTPLISLAAIIICAVDILLRAMKKSQALAFIAGGSYLIMSVNNLITNELNHVSMIAWSGEPRPEDNGQIGWGCPGSSYENIHFQTSIVDTFGLIEQAALKHSLSLKRHPTINDEIPEEKYREFMKIVLRLLRQLDYSAE